MSKYGSRRIKIECIIEVEPSNKYVSIPKETEGEFFGMIAHRVYIQCDDSEFRKHFTGYHIELLESTHVEEVTEETTKLPDDLPF